MATTGLDRVVDDASAVISPLLKKPSDEPDPPTIRHVLHTGVSTKAHAIELEKDAIIIRKLFGFLRSIQESYKASDTTYDGSVFAAVYGILDAITLQWILPLLSPGVAFALRPKPVIEAVPAALSPEYHCLLPEVMETLFLIVQANDGIANVILQRSLSDILSGLADLAFRPGGYREATSKVFEMYFNDLIEQTPTSRLLPLLSAYVQQDVPTWLRPQLAKPLALLPLRTHGIRHVVEYVALSYGTQQQQQPTSSGDSSKGPPLSLDSIVQATRLITAVPTFITPEEWFRRLEPQILSMLDEADGPEMSQVAGHIISSGILSKRSIGSPGTIGWSLFAEPLLKALDPPMNAANKSENEAVVSATIVPANDLTKAVKRLNHIVLSGRNPGVTKRLVKPILLPLWGLACYSKEAVLQNSTTSASHQSATQALARYFELSADASQLDVVAKALFFDGKNGWTFKTDEDGGTEICRRPDTNDMSQMLSLISRLESRVNVFVDLVSQAKLTDDVISSLTLTILRRWIRPSTTVDKLVLEVNEDDPLKALTNAKLAEAMMGKFRGAFLKSPAQIIELIGDILENYVEERKEDAKKKKGDGKVSLASLGGITQSQEATTSSRLSEFEDQVALALSLLQEILLSQESAIKQPSHQAQLLSIANSLRDLTTQTLNISSPVADAARNIQTILTPSTNTNLAATDSTLSQARQNYTAAISDLTSSDPSIRASAVQALSTMSASATISKIIDKPALTHAYLHVILTDSDSFVYTAAIRALADLITNSPNPHLQVQILVDAFLDPSETNKGGLDGRMRVAETLFNVLESNFGDEIDSLYPSIHERRSRQEAVTSIAEACLKLSSRRGQRSKTLQARRDAEAVAAVEAAKKHAEALEAWGGQVPDLSAQSGTEGGEETRQQREEREYLESIVRGWEDTGLEEDVRLRASALSVLYSLLRYHIDLVAGGDVLPNAMDMVLGVLVLERGAEKALLRRAAAKLIIGPLLAINRYVEQDRLEEADAFVVKAGGVDDDDEKRFKATGGKWSDLERVLKWAKLEDEDEIVRDHCEKVLEALETVRMNRVTATVKSQPTSDIVEEGIRGLRVRGPGEQSKKKPLIEELGEDVD